ncbi:MAG: ABC transporter ATP-binding protein [Motilibacteraceae bacterium]
MGETNRLLTLENAGRQYCNESGVVTALLDVSLSVQTRDLVVVLGESGSGKSTLLALAGGLDEPTSGSVRVEGRELGGLGYDELAALRRRHVGYVFQDFNLVPGLTALENVALPLELDGEPLASCRRQAREELAKVGLAGLEDRFPAQLSGGQQQRTAIARALVGQRRLLLADEPTGALDSRNAAQVVQLLRQRCDEGVACVLATHNERHAEVADRVLRLQDGVVVADERHQRTRSPLPVTPA